jgi:cysteine desulfuration protein SufE
VSAPATLAEITETFAFFDDWEDKYRFIIDLGKSLPPLPESARRDENLVRGCQSQVWVEARIDPDTRRLHLDMDSDAHIVRGLIAIVRAVYEGRTPEEILAFDMDALFEELALLKHLSPTRGNGLRALIARIRELAAAHTG